MSNNASIGMGLDAFLKHSTGGSNGRWLKFWTKDGYVKIFLHRHTTFSALWNHDWRSVETYTDRKTQIDKTYVKRVRYVSHDPERVNVKARYKNDDGTREHAPVVDPMAIMIDWIAHQIADKRLSWTAPVFEFKGDDPKKNVILHAGGITGLFGKKEMSPEQERELLRAGVNRAEAFKEDLNVRCDYLFQCVDADDVSAGVVLGLEKETAAGGKLKKALEQKIADFGDPKNDPRNERNMGNPGFNPYAFVFKYDKNKVGSAKYEVETRFNEKPGPEVLELISDRATLQDTSDVTAPYDLVKFRSEIEAYALIKMPFDEFFEPARRAGLMKSPGGARTETKPSPRTPEVSTKPEPAKRGGPIENVYDEPEQGGPCDFCGEILGSDDLECRKCGATYEDDGENIRLAGLKCKNCDEIVELDDETVTAFECKKCGAGHEIHPTLADFYEEQARAEEAGEDPPVLGWEMVKKPEPKPEPAKTRGGRRRASGGAPAAPKGGGKDEAIDAKLEGDDLPWAHD